MQADPTASQSNTPPPIPPVTPPEVPPDVKAATAAALAPATIHPLRSSEVQPRGHRIALLEAYIPVNVQREEILSADFWMSNMNKLSPYCEIICLWDDGSKLAKIMCTHVNGRASRFVPLEFHQLEKLVGKGMEVAATLEVKHKGPRKWAVCDRKTGEVLKDMIDTQARAVVEMNDLENARSR